MRALGAEALEIAIGATGARASSVSQASVACAVEALRLALNASGSRGGRALVSWRSQLKDYLDVDAADAAISERLRIDQVAGNYFLIQTYCAFLVVDVLKVISGREQTWPGPSAAMFGWPRLTRSLRTLLERDAARIASSAGNTSLSQTVSDLYQAVIPASARHHLGEYHTPLWLVDHCIDLVADVVAGQTLRVLDPACGTGIFLSRLIERLSGRGTRLHVEGRDVTPLALHCAELVLRHQCTARAGDTSFRVALGDSICDGHPVQAPLFDAAPAGQSFQTEAPRNGVFDLIVGNPPWMTWDALRETYRVKLREEWYATSLRSTAGWRARVQAGKTDISSLFVYRSAERDAAQGARMCFVLPMSLFKSRHAGSGFRRFRTSGGRSFPITTLEDFSATDIFADASNRASVGVFHVDGQRQYPIDGKVWSPIEGGWSQSTTRRVQPLASADAGSPLILVEDGTDAMLSAVGASEYRARGGINTGGANAVLWLTVLDRVGRRLNVRNRGIGRGVSVPVVEGWIEEDVVYPMLRGRDVTAWSAEPSGNLLACYRPQEPKRPIPEDTMRRESPQALAYLSHFRDFLSDRKEAQRWKTGEPFYELYRIGPYTFAPIKVVWQHTGFRGRLNAAVVCSQGKPILFDQKVISIEASSIEEAHYLCGYLNSETVGRLLRMYLGLDASPHVLDFIALRKFDPMCKEHTLLSSLSRRAEKLVAGCENTAEIMTAIDDLTSVIASQAASTKRRSAATA